MLKSVLRVRMRLMRMIMLWVSMPMTVVVMAKLVSAIEDQCADDVGQQTKNRDSDGFQVMYRFRREMALD